jgi:CRP-like cAMP-binding protein
MWRKLLDLGPRSNPVQGRVLMRQGDPGDVVMVLVRGRVKVTRLEADGPEVPLAFRGPGEVLGDIAVFDGTPRTATVVAVTDCEVRSIAASRFLRFVNDNALTPAILRLSHLRLQEAERNRTELVGLTLVQRVCRALDRLASLDENGVLVVDLAMSQEEFGRMVGSSRNAVVKVLTRLRGMDIVDTRRRLVVIHDREGLRTCGEG